MPLDHIDLHVPDLAAAEPFYRQLLPRLGFRTEEKIEGCLQLRWKLTHPPGEVEPVPAAKGR